MKKLVLITMVLMASLAVYADGSEPKNNEQLKPMLVQGKTWYYTYHRFEEKEKPTGDKYPEDFFDETCYKVSYTVKGDTVINGQEYMKIYRGVEKGGSHYYEAMREDEEGRVWQYSSTENQDLMLCDVTCSSYPNMTNQSTSDVVNIGGQLLRRFWGDHIISVEGVGLEGKGLIHYLWEPEADCICDYESFDYVMGGGIYFFASHFREPKFIQLTESEKQLLNSNNDFAIRLFQEARANQLSTLDPPSSLLLSPLSITYALGMLNNGAAGQTQQEICNTLGFDDANIQNEFCLKMMNELLGTGMADPTTRTSIANTIFVNQGQGYQLQEDFENRASEYYYAHPEARNFDDGQTRDVINQWASDHTNGMIEEVLSIPEFNPLAVSYLLNAIYFKGSWKNPFMVADTQDEPFDGGSPVPMMHMNKEGIQYDENDLYQTVILPYGNGSYQMQIFLPREGKSIDAVLENLNSKNWPRYGSSCEVDLKLPRFTTKTDIDLKTIMSALGMPSAFTAGSADFSKLCEGGAAGDFFIGMMKQVAKIDVNEEGTEAAAVTVIGEYTTSIPPKAEFYANRPFFYTISEQSTGIILFIGQYLGNSPTSEISSFEESVNGKSLNSKLFDLTGRPLSTPPSRGMYIQNGKKIIK